ncbi:MAG: hydroxymethylglutaryl-CoA synthase [Candidatus Thermoplasmatota archaeon]|jgi:hydroxymethylglutaryl-CoA synthase|nr:hydroxymethylglutaryl-CoA synthase [Candidatus Thermoplasmatota archaeon]MCL6003017.1 hydroxymethylglutaryl-CoA synthase [Candidatus Thermoplasmatota archaeon]
MSSIVSYGSYIPRYRIRAEEIAKEWGENPENIKNGLFIYSKSVPGPDEDVLTISAEASKNALKRTDLDKKKIGAIYVGSESHPYAVKPTSSILVEALGLPYDIHSADYEFACKAGTAAMQNVMAMVDSGQIENGIAIGADTSQGAPGDALEYSASAGGTAIVIGKNGIADFNATLSFTTDTPDFWRREGEKYPSHGGRFTGEPAYFKHVLTGAKKMMERMSTKPQDYDYAVLHQPNGKFPTRAAKMLGFKDEQVKDGLLTPYIGNTYSSSMIIGLSAILDKVESGDRILAVAFGSGAGSDVFDLTVNDRIKSFKRQNAQGVMEQVNKPIWIDYATYVKYRGKIIMRGA